VAEKPCAARLIPFSVKVFDPLPKSPVPSSWKLIETVPACAAAANPKQANIVKKQLLFIVVIFLGFVLFIREHTSKPARLAQCLTWFRSAQDSIEKSGCGLFVNSTVTVFRKQGCGLFLNITETVFRRNAPSEENETHQQKGRTVGIGC
jgi:hypothetical protein